MTDLKVEAGRVPWLPFGKACVPRQWPIAVWLAVVAGQRDTQPRSFARNLTLGLCSQYLVRWIQIDKFKNAAAGGQRQFFFHSPKSTVHTSMGKKGEKRPRSTSIQRGLDNRFGLPSSSSTARPPPNQSRPKRIKELVPPGHDDATEGIAGDAEGDPVDMVGPADESTSQHVCRCKGRAQHCARCRLGALAWPFNPVNSPFNVPKCSRSALKGQRQVWKVWILIQIRTGISNCSKKTSSYNSVKLSGPDACPFPRRFLRFKDKWAAVASCKHSSWGKRQRTVWLGERPARRGGQWGIGCNFCANLVHLLASAPAERKKLLLCCIGICSSGCFVYLFET